MPTDDRPPDDPRWRADPLAGSRHSRIADHLLAPEGETDPKRAEDLAARVVREALESWAPALILLPAPERRRVRALTAFALVLFDFARQRGVDGERLVHINRWEFELDAALQSADTEPGGPTQPVFLAMASEHARRPWGREGLDSLFEAARRRAVAPPPRDTRAAAREAGRLGDALAGALLVETAPAAGRLAAAALRCRALKDLGVDRSAGLARWPTHELPPRPARAEGPALAAAARREAADLAKLLATIDLRELPRSWRAAGRYVRSASGRLARRAAALGPGLADEAPGLGVWERVGTLLGSAMGRR